jgi:hypothetical protein
MHQRTNDGLRLLEQAGKIHKETCIFLSEAREDVNRGRMPTADMVDFAYVLKKVAELHEDVRKELAKLEKTLDIAACARFVVESATAKEPNIKGELCTGTPAIVEMPKLPQRDSADYGKLMKHLGVDAKAVDLVRLHWPTVESMVAGLQAEGRPLPPGLAGQLTMTDSVVRKQPRRNVDLSPR